MAFWSKLFKFFDKKERHYVSEVDKRLQAFDQSHPKSPSQIKEIAKHQNIFYRKTTQPIKW